MMPPPIFFIHIPKSGGTSIRYKLEKLVPDRLVPVYEGMPGRTSADLLNRRIPAHAIIYGHFDWGLHKTIGAKPNYAAILRHPVDRLVSWYHWHGSYAHLPLYSIVRQGISLAELLETRVINQANNWMTTLIAGRAVSGPGDRATLDLAKENLSRFCFASVTERINDDLDRLSTVLGTPLDKLPRINVRQRQFEITEKDRLAVLERNSLDLDLYECAASLTVERVNRAASGTA